MAEFNISFGGQDVEAKVTDQEFWNQLKEILPLETEYSVWGEEVYFEVPLDLNPEGLTTDLDACDIAYWPQGNCICIFHGPTPMSTDEKPVPASPVKVFAKLVGGAFVFRDNNPGKLVFG